MRRGSKAIGRRFFCRRRWAILSIGGLVFWSVAECLTTSGCQRPIQSRTRVTLNWPQPHQRNFAAHVPLVARVIRRDTHQIGPDARAVCGIYKAGGRPLAPTLTLDLDSWVRQQVEI